MADMQGVYPILPTPFTPELDLDVESMAGLTNSMVEAGVDGLAILGFFGEAHKLTDAERKALITTVAGTAGGRIPFWVGVRALGTRVAAEQARQAEELGAAAVFVAPVGVQDDEVLFSYYKQVAGTVTIPVVIHDYPESFKITISTSLITRLVNEIGNITAIKLEDPPVGPKTSAILKATGGAIKVFGGLGGLFFMEELERGACGIMTGLAYPEILLAIHRKFTAGDREGAARVFDRYLPYMRYEFQPKIGLAFRKYVYKRRGFIACDAIRHPGRILDDYSAKELEGLAGRTGLPLTPGTPLVIE